MRVLALLPLAFTASLAFQAQEEAVTSDLSSPLSDESAQEWLVQIGAERVWPSFIGKSSLISLANLSQSVLPTPPGARPEGIRMVSISPRVFIMDDFLTADECEFLKAFGETDLKLAQVVKGGDNWFEPEIETRNNEQMWLTPQEEVAVPLLRHVLKRMHRAARTPDAFAEALQIGRYKISTKYEVHMDSDPAHDVGRPATLIVFLNDVEGGGDTFFPVGRTNCTSASHGIHPRTGEKLYGASFCCQTPEDDLPETVRVNPKKGRAVLFFSHFPDGEVDLNAMHIGCPVTQGEKWIAQRWLRFEPYNRVYYDEGPGWDKQFDGIPPHGERSQVRHTRAVSSKNPRVYLDEHFLTSEECDFVMGIARSEILPTMKDEYGWMADAWLSQDKLEVGSHWHLISERVHLLARLPNTTEFTLRIRRLESGGYEALHVDTVSTKSIPATVMIFLNVDAEGGELFFPELEAGEEPGCRDDMVACCAGNGLKVHPQSGDAVLLFSYGMDGIVDAHAQHVACPVVHGESWVMEWHFHFDLKTQHYRKAERTQPQVTFVNMLEEPVRIFWVPPEGGRDEAFMGEIPAGPGKSLPLDTYVGHTFHARNGAGDILERIVVGKDMEQRLEILPEKEL